MCECVCRWVKWLSKDNNLQWGPKASQYPWARVWPWHTHLPFSSTRLQGWNVRSWSDDGCSSWLHRLLLSHITSPGTRLPYWNVWCAHACRRAAVVCGCCQGHNLTCTEFPFLLFKISLLTSEDCKKTILSKSRKTDDTSLFFFSFFLNLLTSLPHRLFSLTKGFCGPREHWR